MAATTHAGIYVRISQDRAGAGLGVERQEQDCRALAERLGWTVAKVYADNDVSAYSGKARPAYRALMDDIEQQRIFGVLVWHPDRLHRSPLELETYIALVEKRGIRTQSVQAGQWDLSTPSGQAIARTLGAWARYESAHKGERIRRSREQQAIAGGWHGGMRPYGFEKDGVTVRPAEAAEIVNAIEQTIAGVSLRSLVRDLNARGIPTATGKGRWSSMALRDIMIRPRIAGLSSYHGEVVGKAVWPALVPEESWRAVCAILTDPARRTSPGGTIKWLGSGLYLCGVCGEPKLRVSTNGSRKPAYRCSNREVMATTGHVTRQAADVDHLVESVVVERLAQPGLAELFADRGDTLDVGPLHIEKAGLEARLDEVAARFADGEVTARQMTIATEKMRERLDVITGALAASVESNPLADLPDGKAISRAWFGAEPDRSDGYPLGKRRAIVAAMVDVTVLPSAPGQRKGGIYFDPETVRIDWKV